jgi:gliding motility-associated lipoprotein GldD
MKLKRLFFILISACCAIAPISCKKKYTPKPRGYYRIDFPQKSYASWDNNYPFQFDHHQMARVNQDRTKGAEQYWLNVNYPQYNATIHISYKTVNNNLEEYLEDSRKMAYKHSIKADAITEQAYLNPDSEVYGLFYRIKGNTASSVQFVATDSTKHFLRGALYFKSHPNQDSLAPVIQYIDQDMIRLIESLKWNQ